MVTATIASITASIRSRCLCSIAGYYDVCSTRVHAAVKAAFGLMMFDIECTADLGCSRGEPKRGFLVVTRKDGGIEQARVNVASVAQFAYPLSHEPIVISV